MVGRRRVALSAKDLGYDVAEIIVERGESGKGGLSSFEKAVHGATKAGSLAAVDECEWAYQWRLMNSRSKTNPADAKGATKVQAWARIKCGAVLALKAIALEYQPHSRKALERTISAIGCNPAKTGDGQLMGQKVANMFLSREIGAKV